MPLKNTPPIFGRLRRGKRREDLSMVRRVTRDAHVYNRMEIRPMFWDAIVFLALTFVLSAIAFLGRPPHAPIVQLHQRPKFTFEAPFDFTYESASALDSRRQLARMSVLPVFRVDTDTLEVRVQRYREFAKALASSRDTLLALPPAEREAAIRELPETQLLPGHMRTLAQAASIALEQVSTAGYLEFLVNDAMPVYEDLCRRGIYDDNTFGKGGGDSAVSLIRRDIHRRELSVPDARRSLLNNIYYQAAGDTGTSRVEQEKARRLAGAISGILQEGLTANIRMDLEATAREREAAAAAEKPVVVTVKAASPLIERDIEVGLATLERWRAFRAEFARREAVDFGLTRTFLLNTLWGVAIMALVIMYSRVAAPAGARKKRAMSLVAIMVVVNLLLMRALLTIAETGLAAHTGEALQWAAPFALAPLVIVVLAGPHMAIVAALLVAGFAAAMNGNSLQVMLASLLSTLVAVRYARGVRTRSRIVTAGVLSSLPVALIAFYDNASAEDWLRSETLTIPLFTVAAGLFTGIFAAGVLPYLENLFKTTTDITLLELTDYNHPLLRKLQILAPGTFHHSVMVANIAERAADDIGANSLLCRCAALYHDIGKMAKPEYFIENQRPGCSPHTDMSPSMSALVIKSHVREGVEIAKEYRLPRVIIDVIEQHHGTGLIRFFFHKACKSVEEVASECAAGAEPGLAPPETNRAVDESLFRYEGPKPQTRESAVILLADSVEAASRSLKKVTPQTVETLVDTLVSEAIKDGQLDECPLTFKEILKLRKSLRNSLLTGLHQRVEYPGVEQPVRVTRPPFAKEPVAGA